MSLKQESPSFARSTRASRVRESPKPVSTTRTVPSSPSANSTANGSRIVVVDGKSYVYRNGELTMMSFGYLVSTKSAINKFGHFERRREERSGVCHPAFAEPEPWDFSCYVEPKAVSEECSQPAKSTQIISQAEFDDGIERKGIALRTQLRLDGWAWEPANIVVIDHDELFDILWKAERLAKRCLWRWLRTNRPRECEWYGIHYLSDMDLGRDRLNLLTFGDAEFLQLPVDDVAFHHFNGHGFRMAHVDKHLYDVQRLGFLLYDEETTLSARSLRHRLRTKAEGEYPWQPHHVELFKRALMRLCEGDDDRVRRQYSPAIIGAMEE
ncbi:hypothetical protein INS49_004268 [Diaporthe citri]|uniref:uncharacterized protein n=1 Tax=Diaporthe citri TaxID=83186 RepID=UPI001C821A7B|nr:uncharacterized protein INS49_004268 [Diaporthe citri]KAG6355187.1 hypothetical protein INS49_004268 [Diaporthe citri]